MKHHYLFSVAAFAVINYTQILSDTEQSMQISLEFIRAVFIAAMALFAIASLIRFTIDYIRSN